MTEAEYGATLDRLVSSRGLSCPWCNSTSTGLIQKDVSRYRGQSFDAWHCFACGIRFASRIGSPDYSAIARRHAWYRLLASTADTVESILSHGREVFWPLMAASFIHSLPWNDDRRYREFLSRVICANDEGRKLSILDAGCARGFVGGIAASLGHEYLGVDVDAESVNYAADQFGRFGARYRVVPQDWYQSESITFDLILCSDVIEHIPDPTGFLAGLLKRLNVGGALILTTPDLDSRRMHVWATDLPPIHYVILNRKALEIRIKALMPDAKTEIFNEDFGPDPVERQALSEIQLQRPIDIDPASPHFAYDAANVGRPRVEPLRRYDPSEFHLTNARTAEALMSERRRSGSSMIAVVTRS